MPEDGANFEFLAGTYKLTLFAKIVGQHSPLVLSTINLELNTSHSKELKEANSGVYFDWGPDQQSYHAHISQKPGIDQKLNPFLELITNKSDQQSPS